MVVAKELGKKLACPRDALTGVSVTSGASGEGGICDVAFDRACAGIIDR